MAYEKEEDLVMLVQQQAKRDNKNQKVMNSHNEEVTL